jgi:hypothetical protein
MTKQDELESREMGRKFAINCVQPLERQSKELAVRWKVAFWLCLFYWRVSRRYVRPQWALYSVNWARVKIQT